MDSGSVTDPRSTRPTPRRPPPQFGAAAVLLALAVALGGATAPEAAAPAPDRGLLWSVEREGERGYLLGSLHFFRHDLYPLPPPLEAAYEEAAVVVFEADLDGVERPGFQARVAASGLLREGETLRDRVPAQDFERLARRAGELGLPVAGLERMRPWFAAVTLAGLELLRLGLDPTQGIDRHLHERARADGKRTAFLEELDFQIDLFADLGDEEAVAFLRQSLDEAAATEDQIEALIAAWLAGDRETLTELVLEPFEAYPTLRERFLDERNRDWVPRVRELLAGGEPVLVVVGSGHLVGESSLVELLRRAGYRVEPR